MALLNPLTFREVRRKLEAAGFSPVVTDRPEQQLSASPEEKRSLRLRTGGGILSTKLADQPIEGINLGRITVISRSKLPHRGLESRDLNLPVGNTAWIDNFCHDFSVPDPSYPPAALAAARLPPIAYCLPHQCGRIVSRGRVRSSGLPNKREPTPPPAKE